ncbi:MAG: GNAT family N-acetyltransferase [Chitinophagia bacterium]|nr:GNAT family N-acetyltransferase [Chitinophagia bacterium]
MNFLLEQVYFITDLEVWSESLNYFQYSDIYHTFEYTHLEAQRIDGLANLLVVSMPTGFIGLPLIFRKIPNEKLYIDATSVYGYNGVLTSAAISSIDFIEGIKKIKDALVKRHCVSFFNRESNFTAHRLAESVETGKVLAVDLTQSSAEYEKSLAEGHRQEIKALQKLDFKVSKSKDFQTIKDFHDVYYHTMLRRGAKTNYFFSINYFDSILKIHSTLPDLRTVYCDGKMVAGAIFVTEGDHMYYMFSGSIIGASPFPAMKLILDEVIRENLQKDKKLLHLGGGLGGKQDTLYQFKNGFGKVILPFYTTQWILIPEIYEKLSTHISSQESFFPKYRSI